MSLMQRDSHASCSDIAAPSWVTGTWGVPVTLPEWAPARHPAQATPPGTISALHFHRVGRGHDTKGPDHLFWAQMQSITRCSEALAYSPSLSSTPGRNLAPDCVLPPPSMGAPERPRSTCGSLGLMFSPPGGRSSVEMALLPGSPDGSPDEARPPHPSLSSLSHLLDGTKFIL